jgi:A/G-specific adenine glycosylase
MNGPLFNADTADRLLAWFEKEGKAYPWGDNISPYRVWVSEIMLQQTVVTAVVPYFTRWMKRFPTPLDLAEAEEEEVLRYWEGLGYYSRGRNLLKAARYVRDRLNGELPGDLEGWKALPGVGDYTARAVLSIALDQPYPVLDANVRRIGQRLLGRREWSAEADRELMEGLEGSISRREPGRFNAALMQLGQLVCRTGTPLCASCPLRPGCVAAAEGTAAEIPERKNRTQTVLHSRRFLLIRDGRILMIRRDHGIGRGLWVLPGMDAAGEFAEGGSGVNNNDADTAGRLPATAAVNDIGAGLAAEAAVGYESGAADPGAANGLSGEAGITDPRGFPRGIGGLLPTLSKNLTAKRMKTHRHTYTRYREELVVEMVNFTEPEGSAAKAGNGERLHTTGSYRDALERLCRLYAEARWDAGWFSFEEITRLPLPAVYRKIMDEARA